MKHTLDINKELNYEVVVCGGGLTGFAAAVTAARSGKRTLLIEKNGCMGGVATSGMVCSLLGGMDYIDGKYYFVTGGLFKELYYDLRKNNECVNIYGINRNRSPHAWYPGLAEAIIFDNEAMKRILDAKAVEAGVHLLYFTYIHDVSMSADTIDYIVAANKDGNTAIKGRVFIDCTGDADIAAMAGNSYSKGRDEDNLMTPATLIMNLENVDTENLLEYIEKNNSPRFRGKILELREKGIWNFDIEIFISMLLNRPGYHMANTIRQVGVDGIDANSLTMGMIEGRIDNKKLYDILVEYFPAYSNSKIVNTGETIGIRETRRIKGKFVLKLSELLEGANFNDIIALSSYCFDLPDPRKPSLQPLEGKSIKNRYTEIPFRTMLPDKTKNLIVAGRSISVEREVLGPIRVMGPCIGMGQAAGKAASILPIENNSSFSEINIEELKSSLEHINCIVDAAKIQEVLKI
ncbi:MAG: FAD-dependent oxidoreductase [Clostridia bacterium]|nr:FAD-dependent oxidoreductase [Clostridia bacterium]MBN2882522.1 FAD-dependent oxidoreductase [Clostridia bacterium]